MRNNASHTFTTSAYTFSHLLLTVNIQLSNINIYSFYPILCERNKEKKRIYCFFILVFRNIYLTITEINNLG